MGLIPILLFEQFSITGMHVGGYFVVAASGND